MRRTNTLSAHSGGLPQSLAILHDTDILVGVHGADLVNGLALQAGASVIEVLPVYDQGCPCSMYKMLFTAEPFTLAYHQMQSRDTRFSTTAVTLADRRTYNADVTVPWSDLQRVLESIANTRAARLQAVRARSSAQRLGRTPSVPIKRRFGMALEDLPRAMISWTSWINCGMPLPTWTFKKQDPEEGRP